MQIPVVVLHQHNIYRSTFNSAEASRALGVPAATVRSWEKRGLIPADPTLARQHRHLWALDIFYLGVLRALLAAGAKSERAVGVAMAAIYGTTDPRWHWRRAPTPARVRLCRRDLSRVSPDVLARDETEPYWLLYVVSYEHVPSAVLPLREVHRYADRHQHFACLNLTRTLAAVEYGVTHVVQRRGGGR